MKSLIHPHIIRLYEVSAKNKQRHMQIPTRLRLFLFKGHGIEKSHLFSH